MILPLAQRSKSYLHRMGGGGPFCNVITEVLAAAEAIAHSHKFLDGACARDWAVSENNFSADARVREDLEQHGMRDAAIDERDLVDA